MNTEELNLNEEIPVTPQNNNLRDELVRLSAAKEIKYSEKYIKKASQSALEKIKEDHQRNQMDKVNTQLTESLISKFSELMEQLNMVENNGNLDKELSSNKLFHDDVKTMVMKISPFIPMIGLLSGGLIVAKHVWDSRAVNGVNNAGKEVNKDTQQDEVQSNQSSSTSNVSSDTSNPDNS